MIDLLRNSKTARNEREDTRDGQRAAPAKQVAHEKDPYWARAWPWCACGDPPRLASLDAFLPRPIIRLGRGARTIRTSQHKMIALGVVGRPHTMCRRHKESPKMVHIPDFPGRWAFYEPRARIISPYFHMTNEDEETRQEAIAGLIPYSAKRALPARVDPDSPGGKAGTRSGERKARPQARRAEVADRSDLSAGRRRLVQDGSSAGRPESTMARPDPNSASTIGQVTSTVSSAPSAPPPVRCSAGKDSFRNMASADRCSSA